MKHVILALILIFPATTFADEYFWHREAAYLALHVADWRQTADIAASPEYTEVNPYLGENPDMGEVNRYFIGTAILHVVVAHSLPAKQARYFQWFTIGVEAAAVGHNASIGISIDF